MLILSLAKKRHDSPVRLWRKPRLSGLPDVKPQGQSSLFKVRSVRHTRDTRQTLTDTGSVRDRALTRIAESTLDL